MESGKSPGTIPAANNDGDEECPRGGTLYDSLGYTDVIELALYAQDSITKGNWALNLGIRGDFYNGTFCVLAYIVPRI